jgi:hypothetical protein
MRLVAFQRAPRNLDFNFLNVKICSVLYIVWAYFEKQKNCGFWSQSRHGHEDIPTEAHTESSFSNKSKPFQLSLDFLNRE